MGNVVTVGPNTALVISGGLQDAKIKVGGRAFVLFCLQRVDTLSLELRTINVESTNSTTRLGVQVNANGVCQVKVSGFKETAQGVLEKDENAIRLAAQHFIGASDEEIENSVRATLEGHQRAILGTLSVEEIYRDRSLFSQKVRELAENDIRNMGMEIVSYTIASLSDPEGYLDSLGVTQTEEVKRIAREGRAKNENEATMFTAERELEALLKINETKKKKEESNRDVMIAEAKYLEEVNISKAKAQAAQGIEETRQMVIRSRVQYELNEEDAKKKRVELDASVKAHAEAELYKQERAADGILALAKARAEETRLAGAAEADALRYKSEVEVEMLQRKALAYQSFGSAALSVQAIEALPHIAEAIAKPLSQTDRIVFMSSGGQPGQGGGGGPSQFINDMARSAHSVTETLSAMTGVDINRALQGYIDERFPNAPRQTAPDGRNAEDGPSNNNPAVNSHVGQASSSSSMPQRLRNSQDASTSRAATQVH